LAKEENDENKVVKKNSRKDSSNNILGDLDIKPPSLPDTDF
jgi:hypothetical protein